MASRKGQTPGTACRFLRLPVVAECGTSGLPAAKAERDPDDREVLRSAVTLAKRGASQAGIDRMRKIARAGGEHHIARTPDDLDRLEGINWLGVVHADGNGLGQVFLKFHDYARTTSDDEYVSRLRAFSDAVNAAAEAAFREALAGVRWGQSDDQRAKSLPVVPIVLGGDDLTVVMDGSHAIRFAVDYLAAFERITSADRVITPIMKAAYPDTDGRVTACAGVAVVKLHYPFSAAYHLAEELIQSAKLFAKSFNPPQSGVD
ncbi:MAG TPA: hypothetical protein VH092_02175, partial [Urbifossiella sp.]|nr:hypothetical protein [Urbifossiella sp.]